MTPEKIKLILAIDGVLKDHGLELRDRFDAVTEVLYAIEEDEPDFRSILARLVPVFGQDADAEERIIEEARRALKSTE